MSRSLAPILAVLAASASAQTDLIERNREAAEDIGAYLSSWDARGELSGVVLVAVGDDVICRRSYGWSDAEEQVENTPKTGFHVASVTKTFTAAAVLLLEDSGALSRVDTLSKFLPDYPRGSEITLKHLLGHASGIPDHHSLPGFQTTVAKGISLAELVPWQSEFPLEFDPRSDDRYGNSGYAVLAYVVERVSGMPFDEFVRREIFAPLGMHATGEIGGLPTPAGSAKGYVPGPPPAGRVATEARNWSYSMGSGSLRSNADDLLLWLRAVDSKALVDFEALPWPYGWGRERYGRLTSLDQTGLHAGFFATISVVPSEDLYVVHLSNLQVGQPFQRVHRDIVRILLGESVEAMPPLLEATLDPVRAKQLTGLYESEGFGWNPMIQADGTGAYLLWGEELERQYLRPIGADRYLLASDGTELRFTLGIETSPLARFELHALWSSEGPVHVFTRAR